MAEVEHDSQMQYTYAIHTRNTHTQYTYAINIRNTHMKFTYAIHTCKNHAIHTCKKHTKDVPKTYNTYAKNMQYK